MVTKISWPAFGDPRKLYLSSSSARWAWKVCNSSETASANDSSHRATPSDPAMESKLEEEDKDGCFLF